MKSAEIITHPRFHFTILGSKYQIAVQRFSAQETISQCYTVQLWLVSEDQVVACEVIENEGCLTLSGADMDRFFHGVINKFSLTGRDGRFYLYQANLVPYFWFLSLNRNFKIYQERTVVEIADELLKARLPTQRYESRLIHKYEKRRYCTQFGESDWRFIARLFEEEGIFYFFQHLEDRHVLTIADDKVAYASIAGDAGLRYHLGHGMVPEKEVVTSFVFSRGITPGRVTYSNYNFKRPSLDLTTQQQSESHQEHEVFQYPEDYGYPERGKRLARVRLEEKQTLEEFGEGKSNCQRFAPCYTFTLAMHDFSELNKEYLLVTLIHSGSQSHVLGEQSGIGGDSTYSNEFLAIPADITLRPERLLVKPYVTGLQSAIVVGPPGEEIYPDEYGRVKVQFHWDRQGRKTEKSSCWLRISQPWSGQGWGMISIPRVGDEVLVDFINGDPDWPIAVGSVNNADSPALYQLPANKAQCGIRTRSYPNGGRDNFHELRFDDKKGSEEIYLQSEKDWNILVKNDKGQTVGNDETLTVHKNRTKIVGVDQSETVGSNNSIQVGANHTEIVGANMSLTIGANKMESVAVNSMENVGLAKEVSVGGGYAVTVIGGMNTAVGLGQLEEVGLSKKVVVGKSLKIEAGDIVEIVCGKSAIKMDKAGNVTIKGTKFDVTGSEHIKLTSDLIDLN